MSKSRRTETHHPRATWTNPRWRRDFLVSVGSLCVGPILGIVLMETFASDTPGLIVWGIVTWSGQALVTRSYWRVSPRPKLLEGESSEAMTNKLYLAAMLLTIAIPAIGVWIVLTAVLAS